MIIAALMATALYACSAPPPAAAPVEAPRKCPKTSSSLTTDIPVNYEDDIASVIEATCLSCHDADKGQSPVLSTYAKVKAARKDVAAAVANESMPKLKSLPAGDLQLFADWAEAGFLEDADSEPVPDSEDEEGAADDDDEADSDEDGSSSDDEDEDEDEEDDEEDDDDDSACPSK